jgi:hypothetical protein
MRIILILLLTVLCLASCVQFEFGDGKFHRVQAYANTMGIRVAGNGKERIVERVDLWLWPGQTVVLSVPGKDQWEREYVWEANGLNRITVRNTGRDITLNAIAKEDYLAMREARALGVRN